MSMTQNNIIQYPSSSVNAELFEKVITANDLAGLTSVEKVMYVSRVCESLGLNPLTKPFQLLKFNGKEVMYATKDATEQLRKIHNVSIDSLDTKIIDGIYIVTASASLLNGKKDSSTGVISITGLRSDALANAMMKAETKAKRRVTLSICGLGMLDESETDTMKGAVKVDVYSGDNLKIEDSYFSIIEVCKDKISQCNTLDDLKMTFTKLYSLHRSNEKIIKEISMMKDEKKKEIESIVDDNSDFLVELT
jgi:hypothetical protein